MHAGDFVQLGTGWPAEARTDAVLTTDGRWLFIGVQCEGGGAADVVHKVKDRDGPVHMDDSIEIFVDPGTDGAKHLHFLLNVGNVQADQLAAGTKRDREWNAGWRSATFVDPDVAASKGWSAEVAIPLYVLRQYTGPKDWRLNICRNKRAAPAELSTWSPVRTGYAEPANFGVAVGLRDIQPGNVFAPLLLGAKIASLDIVKGRYEYVVEGEVMNDGAAAGEVEVKIDRWNRCLLVNSKPFGPTRGEWQEITRTHDAPGGPPVRLRFWRQIPPTVTGTFWFDDFLVEETMPEPEPPKPKNRVINSSFEEAALPGWPDSWFIGAVKPDSLVGDPGAAGQDASSAWHGKYSLKINNPYPMRYGYARAWYRHEFLSSGVRGSVPVERGKTYTLSCYARAEKDGTYASLVLCNRAHNAPITEQGISKRFPLTVEWQRVHVTCTYAETGWTIGMRLETTFFLINQGIACGIYVDAVQLEEGAEPTEYVPREKEGEP